ncbi:hypothetical protein WA171_003931 [Blastocystis sp. BT1]
MGSFVRVIWCLILLLFIYAHNTVFNQLDKPETTYVVRSESFFYEPDSITRSVHQIVDNELETEFLDNLVEIESILKSSGTDIPTLSAENDTSFLVRSVSSTTSQMPSSVLSAFPTSSPFSSTVVPTPASDDTTIHPSTSVFHTSPKPPSSITGHLSLCLIISADNIETIPKKLSNTLRMLSLYQRYFSFHVLMFTKSPLLISICNRLSIEVVTQYERNPYGLPLLRDMIQQGKRLYIADNYGYINADILFSPNLFEALMNIRSNVKRKVISSSYCIAGRVADVHMSDVHLNFSSVSTFNTSLYSIPCKHGLRNRNSADIFIFSKAYPIDKMANAVIGRRKIDSYVLFFTISNKITLIDLTKAVRMLHQGRDTYNHHYGKKRGHDYYFNSQFYDDKYQRSATLSCASFRFINSPSGVVLKSISRNSK